MNKKQTLSIILVFLTSILACAVPGLQNTSGPQPTADSALLSTIVAGTVSGAVVQTEQSAQLTIEALTPTPDGGRSGSLITIKDDSSTLYVDQRAGYEISIPFGWLALRVNEPEYQDSFSLAVTSNEFIQRSLLSIKDYDPNVFRLFTFDVREDHVQNEFVTNINFVWDKSVSISLDTDEQLKASAAQDVEAVPGLEILSTTISATGSGIPLGLIESKLAAKNASEEEFFMFQKQAISNARTGVMVVTVSTVEELKDTIFAELDIMLGTIKIAAK